MPNILFVCTANQFRSPLAAAHFARKLQQNPPAGDWIVSSAGTWAYLGMPAHPAAAQQAARLGLDLSHHRSREVNADILAAADLIVAMEHNHSEALSIEFPQVNGKVALLTELAGDLPVDVVDPFHSAFEDSAEVADALVHYLDFAFDEILSRAAAHAAGR